MPGSAFSEPMPCAALSAGGAQPPSATHGAQVVLKLQKKGAGAPAREAVISPEEQKEMMSYYHKKQEEQKRFAQTGEDELCSSAWTNQRARRPRPLRRVLDPRAPPGQPRCAAPRQGRGCPRALQHCRGGCSAPCGRLLLAPLLRLLPRLLLRLLLRLRVGPCGRLAACTLRKARARASAKSRVHACRGDGAPARL